VQCHKVLQDPLVRGATPSGHRTHWHAGAPRVPQKAGWDGPTPCPAVLPPRQGTSGHLSVLASHPGAGGALVRKIRCVSHPCTTLPQINMSCDMSLDMYFTIYHTVNNTLEPFLPPSTAQHRTVRNGDVVRTGAYRQVVSCPKETSHNAVTVSQHRVEQERQRGLLYCTRRGHDDDGATTRRPNKQRSSQATRSSDHALATSCLAIRSGRPRRRPQHHDYLLECDSPRSTAI